MTLMIDDTDFDEIPEGWRIGDTRPCGCPVEPVAVPCEWHERHIGVAQADCADCEFGVPGVYHYAYGCDEGAQR